MRVCMWVHSNKDQLLELRHKRRRLAQQDDAAARGSHNHDQDNDAEADADDKKQELDSEFIAWLRHKYLAFVNAMLAQLSRSDEPAVHVTVIESAFELLRLEAAEYRRVVAILTNTTSDQVDEARINAPPILRRVIEHVLALPAHSINHHLVSCFVQRLLQTFDDVRFYAFKFILYAPHRSTSLLTHSQEPRVVAATVVVIVTAVVATVVEEDT